MRLPVPGPRDVWQLLERGGDAVEQLLGAVPRLVSLLDQAERLVTRASRLVDDIDATRTSADAVVARTDETVTRADTVVSRSDELLAVLEPLNERLLVLLDSVEPPLTRLQPVLERLADTTAPHEVDAMVELIDHLPALARKMEIDIIPVLDSLSTVAPDLHDLLDVSRELNEMLAKIPGMGRVKDRVDRQQEVEGRG
jgi:DNA repair ATPase RecN